ncbi:MAG: hypothetical protein EOO29_04010, partial [Comamonadaceae bacterium]
GRYGPARIEAQADGDARWTVPAAAFRRWSLPEFDMRLGMVKRAAEGALAAHASPAAARQ